VGASLTHRVMVYFADPPGSLYQLEQWYPTLRAVDREFGLVVVLQDSRTARLVRARSGLDVIVVAEPTTIDDLLTRSSVELALYVNHNPANFTNLRLGQLVHVSLMHGDSDKGVSASNQLKAYDYAFVAGQAAVDRIEREVFGFDASARCIPVGRPQIDEQLRTVARHRETAAAPADGRLTVLYAPTWEGPSRAAAYSSLGALGESLARTIVGDPRFRLVYRPHPLTGARSAAYSEADRAVRDIVERAGRPHRVDGSGVSLAESFAEADVLVSDVSGVAVDWLAVGRPLLMAEPVEGAVVSRPESLQNRVPAVTAARIKELPAQIDALIASERVAEEMRALARYYLGDVAEGAAERRFLEACHRAMEGRTALRAAGVHAGSIPVERVDEIHITEGL
jgi:hypothetical protein